MDTIKFNKKQVKMIAHRGLCGIECENTCAAFVAAGSKSYFGIETDTHVTADGHYVIFHDDTLERMAGIDKNIEEMTLSELEEIRLFDTHDGGQTRSDLCIPRLDEYIRICRKFEKIAVLELKNYIEPKHCEGIARLISDLGYIENTIFISFSKENCIEMRRILPDAKIQFLTSTWEEDLLDWLNEYRLDLDIMHTRVTRELVERIHSIGLEINVWTVNHADRGEELAELGIDYITTNILE